MSAGSALWPRRRPAGQPLSVHTGVDEGLTAVTDDGIGELRDMLVVTDLVMPDCDGLEIMMYVGRVRPAAAIVAM
jgi:CheY-like chemotaxis protein